MRSTSGALAVLVWLVRVHVGVAATSLVADLLTEAYVDNVTWYDVIWTTTSSSLPAWDDGGWPPGGVGAPSASLVGAAVKVEGRGGGAGTRLAFHRTHLDVFGDCWPPSIDHVDDVASYLTRVYSNSPTPTDDPATVLDSVVRDHRAWLQRHVSIRTSSDSVVY